MNVNYPSEKKLAELIVKVEENYGVTIENYIITKDKTNNAEFKVFKFDNKACKNCQLREQCIYKDKNGKPKGGGRRLKVPIRYDAMLNDMKRNETEAFEIASNKRYKVERRFATMLRNHGLQRILNYFT